MFPPQVFCEIWEKFFLDGFPNVLICIWDLLNNRYFMWGRKKYKSAQFLFLIWVLVLVFISLGVSHDVGLGVYGGCWSWGWTWSRSWGRSWCQSLPVLTLIKCVKGLKCQEWQWPLTIWVGFDLPWQQIFVGTCRSRQRKYRLCHGCSTIQTNRRYFHNYFHILPRIVIFNFTWQTTMNANHLPKHKT